MSVESLPLLHKQPVHGQQSAAQQGQDLVLHSKDSATEVSKQDQDTASADAVSRQAPQAYPHADDVIAETSGGSASAAQYMSKHERRQPHVTF